MRRFKQQLPDSEAKHILTEATNGVLSLSDSGGEPYGVPMSFVYDGSGTIYFHCAREGRKMECIRHSDRASFCVVAMDDVQSEQFTTHYRSVIAGGRITVVDSTAETIAGLRMLGEKYSPGIDSSNEIEKAVGHVAVLRFDIKTLSGKEAIELTRRR